MQHHRRPAGQGRRLIQTLIEGLEPRQLLSAAAVTKAVAKSTLRHVGRTITPGIVYRPATDAKPTGKRAVHKTYRAHTQYTQMLPKGQAKPNGQGSTVPVGLAANQVRHAYGLDNLTFNGIVGDGEGQTIAIIDAFDHPGFVDSTDPNYLNSDLHKFSVAMGLPDPPSFRKIDQNGGTSYPAVNPSWAAETALDVEWAHAIAPKANIILVEADSANTYDLIQVATNTARNIPGVTAISMSFGIDGGFGGQDYYDQFFTTPSGHAGVTFLASTGDNGAVMPSGGIYHQGSYPADSANVVAVGGTSLFLNSGEYSSESGWAGSGGGISNFISKPSYQNGFGPSSNLRMTPDVSVLGDPNTGVAIYDSVNNDNGWSASYFGGTSLSVPIWAAMVAITNQGRALNGLTSLNGITQTLPRLYKLPAGLFHDVTTGNNGYAAGAGYDLVTGRGTPIANALLPALAGGSFIGQAYQDNNSDGLFDGHDSALVGLTVFNDVNNNGLRDTGEPKSVTDPSGSYAIKDLLGGLAFNIRMATPAGLVALGPTSFTGTVAYGTYTNDFRFFPTTFAASGATNFVVRLNSSGTKLQIFQNTPTSGTPNYEVAEAVLGSMTFTGSSGDDALTLDLTNGNFAAAHAITFNGGAQTSADSVSVIARASMSSTFASGMITIGTVTLTDTAVESITYTGGVGDDQLAINGTAGPAFTGGGGQDTLTLTDATLSAATDLGADGSIVAVLAGGSSSVNFATSQHLDRLFISGTATATLSGVNHVIHTRLFSAAPGGGLDLGANALLIDEPTLSGPGFVPGLVSSGYAAGLWNGNGVRSSAAAGDASKKHSLGFGSGASVLGLSTGQSGTYLGETIAYGAAVVRYTYYGDTDLNGTVNFNDFLCLQNNFGVPGSAWTGGDFNFDGNTDFNDFLILQNHFGLIA